MFQANTSRDDLIRASKSFDLAQQLPPVDWSQALRHLPEKGPCQFPDLVLRLLEAGERVAAYESDADWFDIGTVHEHERAVVDIEQFPEKYDVDAPMLDPHVSRTLE